MKAVILAGGEGTRLRPLTATIPKPFVRVAGKPTIEYMIESLARGGFDDILLTTYYKPEELIQRLAGGTRMGARLFYSVEDDALGTAGGVARARAFLDDTFIVTSGDVVADVDVEALYKAHKESGALVTIALTRVENVTEFGIVGIGNDGTVDPHAGSGRILRFKEKPKQEEAFSNLVNAGIYVLEPKVFDYIPDGETFDFSRNLFPKLLENGEHMHGEVLNGLWMDVGRPHDLLGATKAMAERRGEWPYRKDCQVAADATVTETALYDGARVGSGAIVTGSLLFEDAAIGAAATVTGSILDQGARVGDGATVTECVLGKDAVVPAGMTVTGVKVDVGETVKG